jgi:hypothetical protein
MIDTFPRQAMTGARAGARVMDVAEALRAVRTGTFEAPVSE